MHSYEKLEQNLIEWSGCNDVVVCSSGTAALHLALETFSLVDSPSPHSNYKVLVPDFTMIACARAVSLANLQPVFIDCDEHMLMNPELVRIALADPLVKVIMPVHVYGRQCDMGLLHTYKNECATSKPTYVIEDLAEAHGVRPHAETDAACWSFYKNKIIYGEEGGAIGFKDKTLAKRARQLRSLGFTDFHDFNHVPRGHNYRLSNVHACMIDRSLKAYPNNIAKRKGIETYFYEVCPPLWLTYEPHAAPWVFDIRIRRMTSSLQHLIITRLRDNGIEARHGFKPMHTQEEYKHCEKYGGEVAEMMSREVIYLPLNFKCQGVDRCPKDYCKRSIDIIKSLL